MFDIEAHEFTDYYIDGKEIRDIARRDEIVGTVGEGGVIRLYTASRETMSLRVYNYLQGATIRGQEVFIRGETTGTAASATGYSLSGAYQSGQQFTIYLDGQPTGLFIAADKIYHKNAPNEHVGRVLQDQATKDYKLFFSTSQVPGTTERFDQHSQKLNQAVLKIGSAAIILPGAKAAAESSTPSVPSSPSVPQVTPEGIEGVQTQSQTIVPANQQAEPSVETTNAPAVTQPASSLKSTPQVKPGGIEGVPDTSGDKEDISVRGAYSCGPYALQEVFSRLNLRLGENVSCEEMNKYRNNGGGFLRDVASLFSREARQITWPSEMKNIIEHYGFSYTPISGGNKLDTADLILSKRNDVVIMARISVGGAFTQHWTVYNGDDKFYDANNARSHRLHEALIVYKNEDSNREAVDEEDMG